MKEDKSKKIQDRIDDYEKDYVKYENHKYIKYVLVIILGIFFVFIIDFIFNVCSKAFSINRYFGYASIIFCVAFICFVFAVPLIKLFSIREFKLNIKKFGKKEINKHNDKICYLIAKSIIDFDKKIPEAKWYDNELVLKLKEEVKCKNIDEVRNILTDLINTSIRKNSNNIIVNYSVKAGLYSAFSQSDKLDAILIFIVNLLMIKDLVFLYGFRPTIARMIRTYISVFFAAASAYGLQSSNIGKGIFKTVVSLFKGFLGGASSAATITTVSNPEFAPIAIIVSSAKQIINAVGDSTVQGMSNGVITAMIGYQAIAYLNEEYSLQDNFKNIDLLDEEKEFRETCEDIQKELKNQQKENKKQ